MLLLLAGLVMGCEPEPIAAPDSEPAPVSTTQFVPIQDSPDYERLRTQKLGGMYVESARAYHSALLSLSANADDFVAKALEDHTLNPAVPEDASTLEERIDEMVKDGHLPIAESVALSKFLQFTRELVLDDYTYVRDFRNAFATWRSTKQIYQHEAPIVYHVSQMVELILATSPATIGEVSSELGTAKTDDDKFCTVRHRNWTSARLGLCKDANESFLGDVYRVAFVAAMTAVAIHAIKTFGIVGSAVVISIFKDVLKEVINFIFEGAWCKEDCDACGPALNLQGVYSGCNLVGLQALGSPFEANEGVSFRIDINQDRNTDFTLRSNPGTVISRSTLIPRNSLFRAQADVTCDGDLTFPWPVSNEWPLISPEPDIAISPSATLYGPPKTNGYYYPGGTSLCFQARIVSTGWNYTGWSAPGGSPGSGTGRSFCVTYNDNSTAPRSILLNFVHPCTGQRFALSADEFVVCPYGRCY